MRRVALFVVSLIIRIPRCHMFSTCTRVPPPSAGDQAASCAGSGVGGGAGGWDSVPQARWGREGGECGAVGVRPPIVWP